MKEAVVLEWSYTLKDYFEDEIRIDHGDYEMIINDGVVKAHINPEVYDEQHNMRATLHHSLNNRFLGVQLITHKPYELSKPSMCRLHPDGRKDVTLFAESSIMSITTLNVDIIAKDKDGNIVGDTRRDRVMKKKHFADLAATYSSDMVASSLLASYNASVNDPDNELVHLYEVREVLSKFFKGEKATRKVLSLSDTNWSRLGQLANNEPLKQGRHRGKSFGELRDATESELKEASTIASNLIEAYLVYLDKRNKKNR